MRYFILIQWVQDERTYIGQAVSNADIRQALYEGSSLETYARIIGWFNGAVEGCNFVEPVGHGLVTIPAAHRLFPRRQACVRVSYGELED